MKEGKIWRDWAKFKERDKEEKNERKTEINKKERRRNKLYSPPLKSTELNLAWI